MIVIKFGLHRKNRKPKKKETNHAKICRKFSNRMQADQRANLRLIVDDLALLLGCFYDPDVIPPDLFALFGLNQQKGENLVDLPISVIETDRARLLTIVSNVFSGSMQMVLLTPSERVTRPLMFFFALSAEKMVTSTTT